MYCSIYRYTYIIEWYRYIHSDASIIYEENKQGYLKNYGDSVNIVIQIQEVERWLETLSIERPIFCLHLKNAINVKA